MIVYSNLNKKFLFLAIATLLVTSLLFMPMAADNLWWREIFNSGHTVLFLVVSFVLFFRLHAAFQFSSVKIIFLAVVVLMLLLGVAIEMIQAMLQREASIDDLLRNFYGISAGLGFVLLARQKNVRNKILALVFSLVFLFLGVGPLIQISWHYMQRDKAFPMVTEFGEKWSSSFVRFNSAELMGSGDTERDENTKFYRLRFDAGQYPGVSVIEPEENWLLYRNLHLNVYSDNVSDIVLVLRVHDHSHTQEYDDRFNKRYVIRPGLNEIEVRLSDVRNAPVDREMDLMNIAGVEFFLVDVKTSLFLEVSNIFLEF